MRTRAASILVLLNLLGATWGANRGVTRKKSDIKLKWLEDDDHKGEKLPHMEITFADGKKDEIFLKVHKDDDGVTDECFFHGSLKGDMEAEVEVDGCKNGKATVQIQSRLIPCRVSSFFLDENGETFLVDPTEGVIFPNSTETDAPPPPQAAQASGATWQGDLPRTATARFHVRVDKGLVEQEGSVANANRKVRRIIDLSRVWFKKHLGLPMDIDLEILSYGTYNAYIGHPFRNNQLDILSMRHGGEEGHPTAWFKAPHNRGGIMGIAHVPGVCYEKNGHLSFFPPIIIELFLSPIKQVSSLRCGLTPGTTIIQVLIFLPTSWGTTWACSK